MSLEYGIHFTEVSHVTANSSGGSGAPEWVHLLPAGQFSGRDGRGPYRVDDPQKVVRASMEYAAGADMVIDYDHGTNYSPGTDNDAAGWIKELEARDDGIWGRVEWTKAAAGKIAAKERRYVSPVFMHAKDGRVAYITHAGLVNNPNLLLTALNSATTQPPTKGDEAPMDLKELAKAMGLPEDSTLEQITAHAAKMKKSADEAAAAHAAQIAEIGKAVGADEGTDADGLITAINSLRQEQAQEPDPSKFVPMAEYQKLATSVHSLQAGEKQRQAEAFVAAHAKKVSPAMKDHIMSLHQSDPKAAKALVEAMPILVHDGQVPDGEPPGEDGVRQSAHSSRVAAMFGNSDDDLKKYGG